MDLQEAVKRSISKFNYPDVIDSSAGLSEIPEIGVVGIPMWDALNKGRKRKIILEIRTFKGISSNAIHYYGKLVADGVYTATLGDIQKSKNLSWEDESKYPLLNYKYEFNIKRPITKAEIDSDPNRWYGYDEGDLTEGYESPADLVLDAKRILKLRFTGDWELYMQTPTGVKSKIIMPD